LAVATQIGHLLRQETVHLNNEGLIRKPVHWQLSAGSLGSVGHLIANFLSDFVRELRQGQIRPDSLPALAFCHFQTPKGIGLSGLTFESGKPRTNNPNLPNNHGSDATPKHENGCYCGQRPAIH